MLEDHPPAAPLCIAPQLASFHQDIVLLPARIAEGGSLPQARPVVQNVHGIARRKAELSVGAVKKGAQSAVRRLDAVSSVQMARRADKAVGQLIAVVNAASTGKAADNGDAGRCASLRMQRIIGPLEPADGKGRRRPGIEAQHRP